MIINYETLLIIISLKNWYFLLLTKAMVFFGSLQGKELYSDLCIWLNFMFAI
jgi:hypothetical protein